MNDMESSKIEIWKPVVMSKPGYDNKYSVSSLGRVRKDKKQYTTFRGGVWVMKEKILSQKNDSRGRNGYMRVCLCNGRTSRFFLVHRLVATAFIENPKNHKTVNHINLNTHDNRVSNLEWMSWQENVEHYQDSLHERMMNGERVSNYRFTKSEVIDIYTSPLKYREISEKYKVNWITIKNIKLGYVYKRITKDLQKNIKRRTRLTKNQISDIYAHRHLPVKFMMDKYGLKQGAVIAVRTGRRYAKITGHIRTKPFKYA